MGHALLLVWDSSVGAREVLPYMGYVGWAVPKSLVFQLFWSLMGYNYQLLSIAAGTSEPGELGGGFIHPNFKQKILEIIILQISPDLLQVSAYGARF